MSFENQFMEQKHAYAQELGFEKRKKIELLETHRTLIIQITHYT